MADYKPRITICIPTFNRGDILLKNVENYLPLLSEKWPLLIVDNGSDVTQTEYKKIASIAKQHANVTYVRKPKNTEFIGNIIDSISLVETAFILFVSDEDFPNIDFLARNYDFLDANNDIGCIRASADYFSYGEEEKNAFMFNEEDLNPGLDAVTKFAINGNYLSGVIYNAQAIKSSGILGALINNKRSQSIYPHMYLSMKLAAKFRTKFTSDISVFLGNAITAEYDDTVQSASGYYGSFAFGNRLDQFIAFRDALLECAQDINGNNFDPKSFYVGYLDLVSKYMHLITLVDYEQYLKHGLNLNLLTQSFCKFAVAAVTKFPMFEQIESALVKDIHNIETEYLQVSSQICNPQLTYEYFKRNFVPKVSAA